MADVFVKVELLTQTHIANTTGYRDRHLSADRIGTLPQTKMGSSYQSQGQQGQPSGPCLPPEPRTLLFVPPGVFCAATAAPAAAAAAPSWMLAVTRLLPTPGLL